MTYFDLNIPYTDSSTTTTTTTNSRLKLALKSLELGYTAVAHNRSIRGVISDRDVCSIPLLPLPSLLNLSPNLKSSATFHRDLLGVPSAAPVRQYTRLTVAVDGVAQCRALNKGNAVLRSYDLVAARPTNQVAFDCVCDSAEVDLISIDFSVPLPFKMKFQNLQTAVKRGVYFEITYSPLIADISTRRQVIHNTQLLVQWTCGKNLILSSGAASVSEIRGPCDVANLSTLLGISTERAKAALSKNCRSLLLNVGKNQCYNNVIKVERAPSIKSHDSKEAWFGDENDWGHISSSEGDALLDQIAKSFAASSEVPKAKTTGSTSTFDKIPSRGTKLKEPLPVSCARVHTLPNLLGSKEFGGSTDTGQVSAEPNKLMSDCVADKMPLASSFRTHFSGGQELLSSSLRNDTPAISTEWDGFVPVTPTFQKSNSLDGAAPVTVEVNAQGNASNDCEFEGVHVTSEKDTQASDFHDISKGSPNVNMLPPSSIPICIIENNPVDATGASNSAPSMEMAMTMSCNGGGTRQNGFAVGTRDMGRTGVLQDKGKRDNTAAVLVRCDMSVDKDHANGNKHVEHNDLAVPDGDILIDSFSDAQEDKHSQAEAVSAEGALVKTDDGEKVKPGTHNKKRNRKDLQKCTDPNLKKRFIELCLQELDRSGRSGETLTLSSWVQIRKRIKNEFGKNYSVRNLKKQYHIWESLNHRIEHKCSTETNTTEWSPETINDSPSKTGLRVDTEMPSIQQCEAHLKETVQIKSNNVSSTPLHSESISCAKVKLQQDDTVRTTGKGCKKRTTVLHTTPHLESNEVKSRQDSPAKTNGKVCKKRRVAFSKPS